MLIRFVVHTPSPADTGFPDIDPHRTSAHSTPYFAPFAGANPLARPPYVRARGWSRYIRPPEKLNPRRHRGEHAKQDSPPLGPDASSGALCVVGPPRSSAQLCEHLRYASTASDGLPRLECPWQVHPGAAEPESRWHQLPTPAFRGITYDTYNANNRIWFDLFRHLIDIYACRSIPVSLRGSW